MKRYGPIIGIVVAIAAVIVIVAVTGGEDDDTVVSPASSAVTTATTAAAPPDTSTAPKPVTYPLSFTEAKEQGITVPDWGPNCDQSTGRVAVPDFFAAECYAPFTGDNGGATAEGVTADSITIAVYLGQANDPILNYLTDAVKVDDTNAERAETMTNMVKYFETYYETYGRTIKLEFVEASGNANDETAARADAVHVAEDIKPFMVWGGPALTNAFADELAAHGVACLACTPSQPPEFYRDRDPLVFGVFPAAEQSQVHVLELIHKLLAGKNAEHAGAAFVDTPRKFGLLYLESSTNSKQLADTFVAGMAANGAPVAEKIAYQLNPATIQQSASQAIAKFKAAGVTSIVLNGDAVAPRDFTKEATAQGYFPEWIVGVCTLVDTNAFARTYDQQQWAHAFGYSFLAAKLTAATSGYYSLYMWFTGVEPPAKDTVNVFLTYPAVFFSALQGVGPNLTHDTWRDALFHYPTTPSAISQPSLSWGEHGIWPDPDYLGIDDGTLFWWNPTATGPDEIRREGTGMYEFVDGGKRYLPGEWPTEDKLFDPDGAVSIYTTRPPGETPPSYPSPG